MNDYKYINADANFYNYKIDDLFYGYLILNLKFDFVKKQYYLPYSTLASAKKEFSQLSGVSDTTLRRRIAKYCELKLLLFDEITNNFVLPFHKEGYHQKINTKVLEKIVTCGPPHSLQLYIFLCSKRKQNAAFSYNTFAQLFELSEITDTFRKKINEIFSFLSENKLISFCEEKLLVAPRKKVKVFANVVIY